MADPLLSPRPHEADPFEKRFQPKQKVEIAPAKNDPITVEELSKHDGKAPSQKRAGPLGITEGWH